MMKGFFSLLIFRLWRLSPVLGVITVLSDEAYIRPCFSALSFAFGPLLPHSWYSYLATFPVPVLRRVEEFDVIYLFELLLY